MTWPGRRGKMIGHTALILALTLLTQLGGIAWAMALFFRRRFLTFALAYTALWAAAYTLSPRTALPCFGEPLRMQSPLYCALNRHYVTPELAQVATDAATHMAATQPGTVTLALDGGFPVLTGMPMIPHLSHDDGEKLDFAFFYTDPAGTYLPGQTRSPLGYFAFENRPPALVTGLGAAPVPRPPARWPAHGGVHHPSGGRSPGGQDLRRTAPGRPPRPCAPQDPLSGLPRRPA
jgi:hypothetical protein